jgi:hypothetical protein
VLLPDSSAPFVPMVPQSPECYASVHQNRINKFPVQTKNILIDPRELGNQSQGEWRHGLEHDAESVFWLLVYWAVVAQPKGRPKGLEDIDTHLWAGLIGNYKRREDLIDSFSAKRWLKDLTHSVYEPLGILISKLASFLVVDRCWLPASDVRNNPEYLNEAFQRSILEFIIDNCDAEFMDRTIDTTLRSPAAMPQSSARTSTRPLEMDAAEREGEAKRRRVDR